MNKILTNHIGYELESLKFAVFQSTSQVAPHKAEVCSEAGDIVLQLDSKDITFFGEVQRWNKGFFTRLDISQITQSGCYFIRVACEGEVVESRPFKIDVGLLKREIAPLLLKYFQSQRCQGKWDEKDTALTFVGERTDTVDVHGGWYDASGDKSKYLSHLNYANFMNPQQTPMVVWALAKAYESTPDSDSQLKQQLKDEMLFGADFLERMLDKEGYFYTTVFDTWTQDPEQREICSYKTQLGYKNDAFQAGWRSGGGMAIAALAFVAKLADNSQSYKNSAQIGFEHLIENNLAYCPDGRENIIDDYCALMAAIELYRLDKSPEYARIAQLRVESLLSRVSEDESYSGWLCADVATQRPFFHAAEEGLPIIALLRSINYLPLSEEVKNQVEVALDQQAQFYHHLSDFDNNAFCYVKQYQQTSTQIKRAAYFYPHNNESGYWWQGENARLLSMSCALQQLSMRAKRRPDQLASQSLAVSAIDWVLGLNPMDMCMLYGVGEHNPIDSVASHCNVVGGISNGITSGLWDEQSIEFLPTFDPNHSWRWTEQWLPHSTWCLLALFADDL